MKGPRIQNGSHHLDDMMDIINEHETEVFSAAMTLANRLPIIPDNELIIRNLNPEDVKLFLEMLLIVANDLPDEIPLITLSVIMDGGDNVGRHFNNTDVIKFIKNDIIVRREPSNGYTHRRKGLHVGCHTHPLHVPDKSYRWSEDEIDAFLQAGWHYREGWSHREDSVFVPSDDLVHSLLSTGWNGDYIEIS